MAPSLYSVVNGLCVFVPFIPGPGTFFSWGFIFPAAFSVGSRVHLSKQRHGYPRSWEVEIAATVAYVALGFFNVHIIAAMWAAV